jgi:hypothetical protein
LVIGGQRIRRGETAEIRLKVAELYNADPVTIPVTVIRGERPGPVLFVTAAVHGDELNGVAILRDLLNRLLAEPLAGLRGSLVAVPVTNVLGFLTLQRGLPDGRDLNRGFPGRPAGSLTSRLAHTLFREVVLQSDFGLDLHTGSGDRANYPQVRGDLADPRIADLAHAFGAPLVLDGFGPERSLRRAAVAAGVPTICYEAGSPGFFERRAIEIGKRGVLNLLGHLGMIDREPQRPPLQVDVRDTRWVRARAGGILDLRVELGQPVRTRQMLAINTNPFGREQSQLRTPHPGLVLGLTRSPLVHPGDAVCHIARLERRVLDSWSRFWESGALRLAP